MVEYWSFRVAVEGHLWGLALYVGYIIGEAAFRDAATAMADKALQSGTPLHTLISTSTSPPAQQGQHQFLFCTIKTFLLVCLIVGEELCV